MRNSHTPRNLEKSRSHTPAKTLPSKPSRASTDKPVGTGRKVYWATVSDNGKSVGVSFYDFPGCIASEPTFEEAVASAYAALEFHTRGEALPEPTPRNEVERAEEADNEAHEVLTFVPIVLAGEDAAVPVVRINVTMRQDLLDQVDAWAAAHGETRSGMLASAARERLRKS